MCYTTETFEADTATIRQIDTDTIALDEKTLEAERRSYHSFFDVHVVRTEDGYILIEEGDYGYCEETGEEIGLDRLEARPIATLSLDAQERWELRQKQQGDSR